MSSRPQSLLLHCSCSSVRPAPAFAQGTIAAWGSNRNGECDVPAPNAGFVAVAAGGIHSLGLKADGRVEAWGDNHYGQCAVPGPNAGFVAVAGGGDHSLGLRTGGTVVAWGRSDSSQCVIPAPNAGFTAIAAGQWHSLGLKADGRIVAWGHSDHGELQCSGAERALRGGGRGWSSQLGPQGRRDDRRLGVEQLRPVRCPRTKCQLRGCGRGDTCTASAFGPTGRSSRGAGTSTGSAMFRRPIANFVAVAGGNTFSLGLRGDGTIRRLGAELLRPVRCPGTEHGVRGGRGRYRLAKSGRSR